MGLCLYLSEAAKTRQLCVDPGSYSVELGCHPVEGIGLLVRVLGVEARYGMLDRLPNTRCGYSYYRLDLVNLAVIQDAQGLP